MPRRIADKAKNLGSSALDAPVSGGDIGAKKGSLAIMCGGEQKSYDRCLNLLEIMGANIQIIWSSWIWTASENEQSNSNCIHYDWHRGSFACMQKKQILT